MPAGALAAFFSLWAGLAAPASAGYDEGAAAFIRGDYEAAWQEWLALGEDGHQSAQYNLGVLYSIGLGVDQDHAEASRWFRQAAERGLPAAQMRLGTAYLEGKGVPEDRKEAYFWYTLAATHFSLGEQHEQAVAARERTGAGLTRAQITAVLDRAMGWKPLAQTVDQSDKERLIAAPTGGKTLAYGEGDGAAAGTAAAQTEAAAENGSARGSSIVEEPAGESAGGSEASAEPDETLLGAMAANAEEMPGEETPGEEMTAAEATPEAAPEPAPLDEAAAPGPEVAAAATAAPQAAAPQAAAPAMEEAEEATEVAAATEAATEAGDPAASEVFAAHLSSVQSREGTELEWQTLRDLYPGLLDGRTLTVRTIEVAEKGTFYRVMAGTFESYEEAEALCSQLQASDQYCVVRLLSEDSAQ